MNQSEYINLHQTCRICLHQEDKMVWMLAKTNRVNDLFDLLKFISESEIVFDKMLPNFICGQCEIKLRIVRDLKITLMRTNKILNECLRTAEQKPEVSEFKEDEVYSIEKTFKITTQLRVTLPTTIPEPIIKETRKKPICKIDKQYSLTNNNKNININNINKQINKESDKNINKTTNLNNFKIGQNTIHNILIELPENISSKVPDEIFEPENSTDLSVDIPSIIPEEAIVVQEEEDKSQKKKNILAKSLNKQTLEEIRKAVENVKKLYKTTCTKCLVCPFKGANSEGLIVHFAKKHKDLSNQLCLECNKIVIGDMKNHHRTHLKCVFCSNTYVTKFKLIHHLFQHTDKIITCKKCSLWFSSRSAFEQHYKQDHSNEFVKCPLCTKRFSDLSNLRLHYKKHKIFKCVHCPARFHSSEMLDRHECSKTVKENELITIKTKPFCEKCQIEVKSLKVHNKHHHKENVPSEKKPYKRYLCSFCGKSYKSLSEHIRIHTGEKPYACNYCPKRFRISEDKKEHERTHTGEKAYVCETCGKTFARSKVYYNHRLIHQEKTLCCTLCPRKFHRLLNLKDHMRVHTGEKPYQCNICHKRFSCKPLLHTHTKRHGDERSYGCDICGKRFKTHISQYMHALIHSDDKPFKCTLCDYETVLSFSLTQHVQRRHPEMINTIGKNICDICHKSFSSEMVLNAHKELRHKEQ